MKIAIEGIGVAGGFGCGLAALRSAMEKGNVSPQSRTIHSAKGDMDVPALLTGTSLLTDFIPWKSLRRNDHYTRMALLGSFLAMEDAGLRQDRKTDLNNMGIIVATGLGSTCNTLDFEDIVAGNNAACSPTRFSNSVHNAAAAHISIFLNACGPNLSINQFDMSLPSAILTACCWLEEERTETVLVGGVDEFSNVMAYYRHNCFAGDGKNRIPVGEGCAFFLLTAKAEQARYGYILDAAAGNAEKGKIPVPADAAVFCDRESYEDQRQDYERHLEKNQPMVSCSHLYGNIPVGMGFDMAIASLGFQTGISCLSFGDILRTGSPISPAGPVCCLKINPAGEYGMITISPAL
ncbi:MAG: beta-ketoacyl synthase N-terminal-like domain-containing protein [Desulfococcaceae bacterium]